MYLAKKHQTLIKTITILLIICFSLFAFSPVFADKNGEQVDTKVEDPYGIKTTGETAELLPKTPTGTERTIPMIIGYVIGALLSLMGVLFIILIIAGGIMWMTAGGTAEKVQKAGKIMANAAIGLIIILAAYAITSFVLNQLTTAINPYGETMEETK